jgi:hypothetical protein
MIVKVCTVQKDKLKFQTDPSSLILDDDANREAI